MRVLNLMHLDGGGCQGQRPLSPSAVEKEKQRQGGFLCKSEGGHRGESQLPRESPGCLLFPSLGPPGVDLAHEGFKSNKKLTDFAQLLDVPPRSLDTCSSAAARSGMNDRDGEQQA